MSQDQRDEVATEPGVTIRFGKVVAVYLYKRNGDSYCDFISPNTGECFEVSETAILKAILEHLES